MDNNSKQRLGQFLISTAGGETVRAFLPPPLPPDPPVRTSELQVLLEQANLALGRLDGCTSLLPDISLFLYAYVRKEAVLSSQIEGTQSSLSDLLVYENSGAPGVPIEDVQEVSNYVAALNHGMDRLRGGFPLSLRLLREIHAILLHQGKGSSKEPGEFRRSQNWIGGTRPGNAVFVPPPADRVLQCMGQLELFLHEESSEIPLLIRAGLAHVQFETIHPFLDGNGRLGRLLITFLLCARGAIREPILYLSLYLKTHRARYYDLLSGVRANGDWESWLEFFLTAVKETADQAVGSALRIRALLEADRRKIETLGRAAPSVLRVFQYAQTSPVLSITATAEAVGMTFPTVAKAVARLELLGILNEITGMQRGRHFVYGQYLAILSEGTDPIRP